ncbi:MAG: hypothetical protein AAF790_05880 [Planctomycetota bacterium]
MTELAAQQAAALPQPEEGIEPDDLNTTMIVAIGLISTALVLASVLGLTALVGGFEAGEVERKVNQAVYGDAESAINEQRQALSAAARPNTNEPGVYSIPISHAKKLVVQELRAQRGLPTN